MKLITLFALMALLYACSYDSSISYDSPNSALTVAVIFSDTPERASRATTWAKLHLKIIDRNNKFLIDTAQTVSQEIAQFLLQDIPADSGYQISLWTTNEDGDTIHSPLYDTVTILADQTTQIACTLVPRVGSVMMQLYDLGTDIDSLTFSFISDSGSYEVTKKRSSSLFLSLDNVPYGATGELSIFGFSSMKDTILSWDTLFTFTGFQNIEISFAKDGSLSSAITIEPSSNSIFSGSGTPSSTLLDEVGRGIVISEFCATAGSGSSSRDFIELYNASDSIVSYDALSVKIGSTNFTLDNISLASHQHVTIGSSLANDVWAVDSIQQVDITATSGQLYLYSGDTLVDYVLYYNDSDAGWPKLSSSAKTSWECQNLTGNPEENNYPRNWRASSLVYAQYDGDDWLGTPSQ